MLLETLADCGKKWLIWADVNFSFYANKHNNRRGWHGCYKFRVDFRNISQMKNLDFQEKDFNMKIFIGIIDSGLQAH